MTDATVLPRRLLLAIAVLQGFALLYLYRSVDSGFWPHESPVWAYPLWTLVIAVPILLLLSLERGNEIRTTKNVGLFAIGLTLVSVYIGSQARPFGEFPLFELTGIFACTMTLACFKALMYIQQRSNDAAMTYDVLFSYSWRNALTFALSSLFVLVFWLILMLCAALFSSIGVEFFKRLFQEDWFLFPVLGFALGLGVIIFRNLTSVIDGITRLLQGLIKLLLPLAVSIAVVFLLSLPFVGIDALWDTGHGTALLLFLLATILFFINAVYQDGRGDKPYPVVIHRAIYAGLPALLFLSGLSLYGLYLRLHEYGWTVFRAWAFLVWLLLSLFALGYVVGIVRKRDNWTSELARVNTGMGLVILAFMLLTNSPLLDFRKLALSSQLDRVDEGRVELAAFDYWYVHHKLARPGYLALEQIKADIGDSDADLLAKIENPVRLHSAMPFQSNEDMWREMVKRPADLVVPAALQATIDAQNMRYPKGTTPFLIATDLDADGTNEYVLIFTVQVYANSIMIFYTDGEEWKAIPATQSPGFRTVENLHNSLTTGDISVERPRFGYVRIGELVVRPLENTE